MSNIDQAETASTETFVTALVFNAAVFGIELAVFTLIRPYFKAIYEPRTYVPEKPARANPLTHSHSHRIDPRTYLSWPLRLFQADHRAIKKANGLDAYFFVRYLRMMVKVFLPIWIVTWAVLLPITSVNSRVGENKGLDLFVFGNVEQAKRIRYSAHIILVWISTIWVFYNIRNEMRHFIVTRQRHLIDPDHGKTVQANTVLITGIPARYLTPIALRKTFNALPGGVKNVWINRNLKELPEIYERRMKACNKLEAAETKLLSIAAKTKLKEQKGKGKKGHEDPEAASAPHDIVPRDQRPTHKLGFLGLFGEKVDSIDWARQEIRTCNELLEEGRAKIPDAMAEAGEFTFEDDPDSEDSFGGQQGILGIAGKVGHQVENVGGTVGGKIVKKKKRSSNNEKSTSERRENAEQDEAYPPVNSAFITFRKQVSAHLAGQVLVHHEPYRMSGKHIEVSPTDVIWENLGLNPYEMKIRVAVSWGLTLGLIIFWSIPVAFVGAVSNVYSLCSTYRWLNWICSLPSVVVGIISGILPPVLLAVLFMLLPIVLRMLAKFEGIPKRSGVELSLMTRYFIFLVLHGFLIVTLASGIMSGLNQLVDNPTSIPSLLAQKLPTASTFFLTFVVLKGLSGTAGGFLQIVPLAIYYVKLFVLGSTPRSVYGIKYAMGSVAWGTLFPNITLLTVIALGYSIISPIINGLACFTFFAFYMLYKFLFLYVYQQDVTTDTGGLFFPKAIQHVFVGLYIQQLCLAALFFLAGGTAGIVIGALTVVLIVSTIAFHIVMNNSYGPLIHALPLSLVDKMHVESDEADDNPESEPTSPTSATSGRRGAGDIEKVDSGSTSIRKTRGASIDTRDDTPLRAREGSSHHSKADMHNALSAPRGPPEHAYGFAHPAASRPQRIVWIPQDTTLGGMGEEEATACRSEGVAAVCGNGAMMNEKGKVNVEVGAEGEGGPPDML
ncbi:phosphate metabolism protein 7 [Marasmius tenuissimus]|nr:phosphate metabolism protein 7 [Marasmius tenuissimus]